MAWRLGLGLFGFWVLAMAEAGAWVGARAGVWAGAGVGAGAWVGACALEFVRVRAGLGPLASGLGPRVSGFCFWLKALGLGFGPKLFERR